MRGAGAGDWYSRDDLDWELGCEILVSLVGKLYGFFVGLKDSIFVRFRGVVL